MGSIRALKRPPLVLVADRVERSADLTCITLAAAGYQTHAAHDGREVIALALILQPVVIVMSTKLPSVTGCEATRILKKDPATHRIRVLIYTGHVSGPHLTWAQRCGCDALLPKPSLPGELESEVARLIAMGAAGPVVPLPNVA